MDDPLMVDLTTIYDMSTAEIVKELIVRITLTNGLEFCETTDLETVIEHLNMELHDRTLP